VRARLHRQAKKVPEKYLQHVENKKLNNTKITSLYKITMTMAPQEYFTMDNTTKYKAITSIACHETKKTIYRQ